MNIVKTTALKPGMHVTIARLGHVGTIVSTTTMFDGKILITYIHTEPNGDTRTCRFRAEKHDAWTVTN